MLRPALAFGLACALAGAGPARGAEAGGGLSERGRQIHSVKLEGDGLSRDFNGFAGQLKAIGFELSILQRKRPRVPAMEGMVTAGEAVTKLAEAEGLEVEWLPGREGAVLWRRAPGERKAALGPAMRSTDPLRRRDAVWEAVALGDIQLFRLVMAEFKRGGEPAVEPARAIVKNYFLRVAVALDEKLAMQIARQALTDEDASVRADAASKVSFLRTPEALELLKKALGDEDTKVRRAAIKGIGYCGTDGVVGALAIALGDEDPKLRAYVARAAGWAKGPKEGRIALLRRAMADKDDEVRLAAENSMTRLGGPGAAATVRRRLKDPSESVRGSAITYVGGLSKTEAVDILKIAMDDESPRVRRSAVRRLKMLDVGVSGFPVVEKAMMDSDGQVRQQGFQIAEKLGGAEGGASPRAKMLVLGAIKKALRESDPGVRSAAARSAAVVGGGAGLDHVEKALSDEDVSVRRSAAFGLGRVKGKRSLGLLARAFDDENYQVRESVVYALGLIGVPDALPLLRRALADRDPNIPNRCAEVLGRLGPKPEVVAMLKGALADDSVEIRRGAAQALGYVKSPVTYKAAFKALDDPDAGVRAEAIESLGRLGGTDVVGTLSVGLGDDDDQVRARTASVLGGIANDEALEMLARVMKEEPSWGVRIKAIHNLYKAESKKALEIITKGLNDDSKYVRSRAVYIIRQRKKRGLAELKVLLERLKVETDREVYGAIKYTLTGDKAFKGDPRVGPAVEAGDLRMDPPRRRGHIIRP